MTVSLSSAPTPQPLWQILFSPPETPLLAGAYDWAAYHAADEVAHAVYLSAPFPQDPATGGINRAATEEAEEAMLAAYYFASRIERADEHSSLTMPEFTNFAQSQDAATSPY
jgi:hypothetical protein